MSTRVLGMRTPHSHPHLKPRGLRRVGEVGAAGRLRGAPPAGLRYFQNACCFVFFFSQEKPKMSCHPPQFLKMGNSFLFFFF